MSHPVRVRGLKHGCEFYVGEAKQVAPRAGAWVETRLISKLSLASSVAPRAGAWVETQPL